MKFLRMITGLALCAILALLLLCAFMRIASAQTAVTVTQVTPFLASICSNDGAAVVSGTLAYYKGFACSLRVHTGRGGGVRIFSGCANLVYDSGGTLIEIEPTAWTTGATIACP